MHLCNKKMLNTTTVFYTIFCKAFYYQCLKPTKYQNFVHWRIVAS